MLWCLYSSHLARSLNSRHLPSLGKNAERAHTCGTERENSFLVESSEQFTMKNKQLLGRNCANLAKIKKVKFENGQKSCQPMFPFHKLFNRVLSHHQNIIYSGTVNSIWRLATRLDAKVSPSRIVPAILASNIVWLNDRQVIVRQQPLLQRVYRAITWERRIVVDEVAFIAVFSLSTKSTHMNAIAKN